MIRWTLSTWLSPGGLSQWIWCSCPYPATATGLTTIRAATAAISQPRISPRSTR